MEAEEMSSWIIFLHILRSKCSNLTGINTPSHSKQPLGPSRFSVSLCLPPLLFPLLSSFCYSLSSAPSSGFPWYPCLLLSSSPGFPLPSLSLSLSSFFACLLFHSAGNPFSLWKEKKGKKNLRLVSNLNNWAAQFSSSRTLWGENGRGGDFVPRQGDRDEHVSGLCQYVFSQDEINANFICTLRQRGPDENLALPLEQREGWRGGGKSQAEVKMGFR